MFEKAEILDRWKHQGLGYKPASDYRYASSLMACPIAHSEMTKVSREYPIVFSNQEKRIPLAHFSVKEKTNAFVNADNNWNADYIPAHVRRYPFVLGDKGDGENFYIMADSRGLCNDHDAEELFQNSSDEKEGEKGVIGRATDFLVGFERELKATEALIAPLYEYDILAPKTVTLEQRGNAPVHVSGVLLVDRPKLAALNDSVLGTWARSGLLDLVSLHLASQENWLRLVEPT